MALRRGARNIRFHRTVRWPDPDLPGGCDWMEKYIGGVGVHGTIPSVVLVYIYRIYIYSYSQFVILYQYNIPGVTWSSVVFSPIQ